jgi:hypothetical protein
MPFTLSHTAAILPVSRRLSRWHVLSAAVIGSMVPDLEMLLPGDWPRWSTHSLPALLYFCLPLGLALYGLTQWLIKPAVTEVLPPPQRAWMRLNHPVADLGEPWTWLAAAAAVLFGALTHLVWDAFTHEESRGVRMLPVLRDYGPDVGGHPLRLYRWLQHGSSVVGLVVVLVALWLWYERTARLPASAGGGLSARERCTWLAVYVSIPLLALIAQTVQLVLEGASFLASSEPLETLAILGMRAGALSLVVVSVVLLLRLRLTRAGLDDSGSVA